MSSWSGFRLAVGLLTIVPVRPPDQIGRDVARSAMLLAPVAVLPVALASGSIGWLAASAGLPSAVAGALAIAALALGTRAMHTDGLADTVDGLGSGKPAEAALQIMKRGDIGPMGTVALVLTLLIQSVAAGVLVGRPWGWLTLTVVIAVSRGALSLGCVTGMPSARPGGLGALVAGSVPVWGVVVVWLVALAALQGVGTLAGWRWWLPLAAAAGALAACGWLLVRCRRRLGGITGDVLGALVELAAAALLVITALG